MSTISLIIGICRYAFARGARKFEEVSRGMYTYVLLLKTQIAVVLDFFSFVMSFVIGAVFGIFVSRIVKFSSLKHVVLTELNTFIQVLNTRSAFRAALCSRKMEHHNSHKNTASHSTSTQSTSSKRLLKPWLLILRT